MGKSVKIESSINRYSEEYQEKIANLLSLENLSKTAIELKESEIRKIHDGYKKKVIVEFIGLSSITLLGGMDPTYDQNESTCVTAFTNILSNQGGIIDKLKEQEICVEIRFIFAYPYSDFVHELVACEKTRQEGFSVDCIKNQKSNRYNFNIPVKLTYEDLIQSPTYWNLRNSLKRLQENVIKSKHYNNPSLPNRVVVKFTPLNILACYMKINNFLFIDPYLYSKKYHHTEILALTSPISSIELKNESGKDLDDISYDQYLSFKSHFQYLWSHPLTLYWSDATQYVKGVTNTLSEIIKPEQISYSNKANRIFKKLQQKGNLDVNNAEIDLWKQYCKNELLRFCSKFYKKPTDEINKRNKRHIKINPVTVFIVGAWTNGDINPYMKLVDGFLKKHFGHNNDEAMRIKPIIIDPDDGRDLTKIIYDNLNLSQLGIVIQTADNKDISRPNVYLEKGFLLGKIGKKTDKQGKEKEVVFVFKEEKAQIESDSRSITHTPFLSQEDFEIQFFRILKWLWDLTEINSTYAIKILNEFKKRIEDKRKNDSENHLLHRYNNLVDRYIEEIKTWKFYNEDTSANK